MICPRCAIEHPNLTTDEGVPLYLMGLPVLLCPATEGQSVILAPPTFQSDRLERSEPHETVEREGL